MSLKPIYQQLNIDNKLTKKRIRNQKEYNSFEDNYRQEANCNFMLDLLFLPTAKYGMKFLLVCLDIATRKFDMEPIKDKTSTIVLKAFKKMIKRQYISLPKYSVITDGGSEFKGLFQDFMYDESIFHKTTVRGRHKQLALIDNLIGQLSKIFNDYMNTKEVQTGKVYKNWTEIIPIVREELNKIREVKLPSKDEFDDRFVNDIREVKKVIYNKKTGDKIETIEKEFIRPKYKVGQLVYVLLDHPKNALGKNQSSGQFRMGDVRITSERHEITEIVYMNGKGPVHRYIVDGFRHARL
jgi:hypothetical protein